jgi:NarL family two-component system response regulator LiaR
MKQVLTPRQKEVAQLLVNGASNQEIAATLYLDISTVKNYIQHLRERAGGAKNRVQLAVSLVLDYGIHPAQKG